MYNRVVINLSFFHKPWQRFFKKRYYLAIRSDEGQGIPVVLLHGIASNSDIWEETIAKIDKTKYRVLTIDLLGFGQSPKPATSRYSLDEQAKLVARSLRKKRIKQPVILVGHSLGGLVSLEIASQKLIKIRQLILCSPPIYVPGDFKKISEKYKKTDRARSNAYFYLYSLIAAKPKITLAAAKKSANKLSGFTLTEETWLPFKYSLINAINGQNSLGKLKRLKTQTTIIYGKLDPFIIPKHYKQAVKVNPNISLNPFRGYHRLNINYSRLIANFIKEQL